MSAEIQIKRGSDGRRLGLRTALALGWVRVAPADGHGGGWHKDAWTILWQTRGGHWTRPWVLLRHEGHRARYLTLIDALIAAESTA
jgi:hypothetical protein